MIDGKFVLQGRIELCAPTLIGSGRDDESDIDVLLDVDQQTPFIPATSLLGVLKQHIRLDDQYKDDLKRFWGFTRKDRISADELERQSSIRCSDLYPQARPKISRRDGIKIDRRSGIVVEEAKYDYQVIERGAKFDLSLEIDYSQQNKPFRRQMLATICHVLATQGIRLGAKTNNGLGQIRLQKPAVYDVDFSKAEHVRAWLQRTLPQPMMLDCSQEAFALKTSKAFIIEAAFDLKHSLIVRSYPSFPQEPDAVNVTSGETYAIPGSSLKGAIRARAERIVNTLRKADTSIITELFGEVDDRAGSETAKRGKLRVKETLLPTFISELHHRVKIDRFTGGTIEAALFDTQPVYPNLNDKTLEVTITLQDYTNKDYQDYEAGLMLLVLKDLWTGDLAIGGEKSVGRGVLQGNRAYIHRDNRSEPIVMTKNFTVTNAADRQDLESLVNALKSYLQADAPSTQEVQV